MKKFTTLLLSILSLLLVLFLWENNLLLFILLMIIGILMLLINKSKTELIVFLFFGFSGAIAEAIAIYCGIWEYANSSFLGIPIWLPVLWAIASIYMLRVASFIRLKINED